VLEQQGLGHCVVDANNGIDCMVFNPNPDIVALVISLNDGRLCVFDYFTMKQMFTVHKTFAQSVACSPDGHSLVTGGSHGTIEVFDFDHDYDGNIILVPIYRIDGIYDPIRSVAFSFNGLRFLDVHRQQCRVWEPAALVRTNNELESTSDAATLPVTAVGAINGSEDPEITSVLEITSDGRYAIGGNQRGEVSLFSIADGAEIGTLYRHAKGVSVTKVALGESRNLVVSADESGRVLISEPSILLREVTKLVPGQKMPETHTILDRRFGGVVVRLLLNSTADRLLVTGHNVSQLWALPSGDLLAAKQEANVDGNLMESHCSDDVLQPTASTCAAFQHPSNDAWFVTMSGNTARVFSWANYEELTSKDGILLQRPKSSGKAASPRETRFSPKSERFPPSSLNADCIFAIASYHVGCGVVIETLQAIGTASPQVNIWPAAAFDPYSPRTSFPSVISPSFSAMRSHIRSVIGFISPSNLIFLDTRLWVCSIDIQLLLDEGEGNLRGSQSPLPGTNVRRHFFALSEWCDAEGEMKCSLVVVPGMALQNMDHEIVFVSGHRLVTIKGGFQFSENMTV
jgi:WD40 repeat protein